MHAHTHTHTHTRTHAHTHTRTHAHTTCMQTNTFDAQKIILSIPMLAIAGAIVDTQPSWRKEEEAAAEEEVEWARVALVFS